MHVYVDTTRDTTVDIHSEAVSPHPLGKGKHGYPILALSTNPQGLPNIPLKPLSNSFFRTVVPRNKAAHDNSGHLV